MDLFHDDLHKLIPTHNRHKLVVRWTPGHLNIPGNKAADEQAKLAARGNSSETLMLPKLLRKMTTPPSYSQSVNLP